MTSTHQEVSGPREAKRGDTLNDMPVDMPVDKPVDKRDPARKVYTPMSAAIDIEAFLSLIEGRWKLEILFHLFGGQVQRFSDLEKRIDGISQKMLSQQLRQLEADGLIERTAYPEVPPRVDYRMTAWGQALCPALDSLLLWGERRAAMSGGGG